MLKLTAESGRLSRGSAYAVTSRLEMVDAKTLGVVTSLGISLAVLTGLLLLFEVLRRQLSNVYYYRNHAQSFFLNHAGQHLGTAPLPGAFWPATVAPYKHSDIRTSHGIDDALFLRFLRTQAMTFFLITVIAGAVLFPVYATGSNADLPAGNKRRIVGIEILSLANIPARDNKLWAVLAAELIVVVIICCMQYADLEYYTELRCQYRAAIRPANYAVLVADLPEDTRTPDSVFSLFDTNFPDQVKAVHIVRRAGKIQSLREKYQDAFFEREQFEETGEKGTTIKVKGQSEKVDASEHYRAVEEEALAAAVEARSNLEQNAPTTHAAFVIFRTRQAATAAVNTPIAMNGMIVRHAPEPDAVCWARIHPSKGSAKSRTYLTYAMALCMIIFWFVPVAGVQLLSNLEDLGSRDNFGVFKNFAENLPALAKLVEGTLPSILLIALNALVPVFVRLILVRARFFSNSTLDAAVLRWVFAFLVATSFIGNIVVGSLVSTLATITENPTISFVIELLSQRIPAQSTFFLNYVALQMGLLAGKGILMVPKLILRPCCMAGAKSDRMRRLKNDALSAVPFFKLYAILSLHTLIGTVYSVVAPICPLFVGFGYCLVYVCMKHVVMYSQRPKYYCGGRLFKAAWEQSFFSLFLHQVILVGLFSLKEKVACAIIQAVVSLITLKFARYVTKKFTPFASHGTLNDLRTGHNGSKIVPDHYQDSYLHPGLRGEVSSIPPMDLVEEVDY